MSFTGDLEHLPIVDVVQLLHATRKSGILHVRSRKGESQLVFKDGYIVSANHLNDSVRIGKILVDLNVITSDILDRTLREQKKAGEDRKPLIVMLLEQGLVREEDAYKGLEQLIEMTVVEILTWKKGTFTLDVPPASIADGYRYYPEKISREINVDTQSVLMDALRILDERMRDGELADEGLPEEEALISADDLGLADLDLLAKETPQVFTGLPDFDPRQIHRQIIDKAVPGLPEPEREELASFLGTFSLNAGTAEEPAPREESALPAIFLSADEFTRHAVPTACMPAGIHVLTGDEEQDLDQLIVRFLAQNRAPILVLDAPDQSGGRGSRERTASLRRRKQEQYPGICTIQLAPPGDAPFALQAYQDGVRAVIPRPLGEQHQETFVADTIQFLTTLRSYLAALAAERENSPAGRLKAIIARLHGLREAPEVALALLECVAGIFERSVTLIVREAELIAERGIGVKADKSRGATTAPGVRISLARPSLLRSVIEEGRIFYGATDDEVVREHLVAAIGAPRHPTLLLLPLKSRGKTLAIIYGDFGGRKPVPVDIGLLEIVARQAELVLENALYRKRLEKPAR